MGTLHHHPFFIRYQGGAGDHVVQIRAGRTIRSGVGQSFWLRAGRCALAEGPTANRARPGRTPRACGRSTKPSPASLSPPWPRRLGR